MLLYLWRHAYPTIDMHIQDGEMHTDFVWNDIFYTENDIENL
jgi:hypothetical protein